MRIETKAEESIGTDQESIMSRCGPVYALFTANIISYVGSRLTLLAIPWFVLQTTGSVAQMGITAFVSTVPLVISAFLGSAIIDRLGFKRASVVSDIVSGICVGVIPLLADTVGLAFWQLLVLVFLGGLLKTPGQTARSALVPDLAGRAKMRLERANAISDGVSRISNFIGAPLAALLIIAMGTANLLWLDAISFFISAVLVSLLVPTIQARITAAVGETRYFLQLREGVRFILSDSVLLAIIVSVMMTNLLDQALSAIVAPAYILQVFHSPLPLGWIFGVLGGTAFVGTLIFGMIGHRLPRRLTFGVGFTLGGALRFWILLVPILPLLVAVYAIAGLGLAPINPLIDTLLQERVPSEMRARVFGTTTAGAYIGIPIGSVLGGFLVAWIGMQASLLAMGALYFVTTLSLLVNPAFKKMDA
jgi:MFS family permease